MTPSPANNQETTNMFAFFKEVVNDALSEYDCNKGFLRRLFGDHPAIKALKEKFNSNSNDPETYITCFTGYEFNRNQASLKTLQIIYMADNMANNRSFPLMTYIKQNLTLQTKITCNITHHADFSRIFNDINTTLWPPHLNALTDCYLNILLAGEENYWNRLLYNYIILEFLTPMTGDVTSEWKEYLKELDKENKIEWLTIQEVDLRRAIIHIYLEEICGEISSHLIKNPGCVKNQKKRYQPIIKYATNQEKTFYLLIIGILDEKNMMSTIPAQIKIIEHCCYKNIDKILSNKHSLYKIICNDYLFFENLATNRSRQCSQSLKNLIRTYQQSFFIQKPIPDYLTTKQSIAEQKPSTSSKFPPIN